MAEDGCVIPKKGSEVRDMLKLAFPVTANKKGHFVVFVTKLFIPKSNC